MRLIFFGAPNFAKIILESLIKNEKFCVSEVVTNIDKPFGRKKILTPSPVKQLAIDNNIEILQPARLKDLDFIKKIEQSCADLFVVASYGKIIPKEVLEIPKFGCINVHGSLLPEYRGASPIQSALLGGEKETGITIMLMDEGMDTGPILSQEKITINENDNFVSLSEKMAVLGARMLDKTLPLWIAGKIKPVKQDNSRATYTRLFKAEDYKIDWNKSAERIHNLVKALYPNAYGIARIKNHSPAGELRIKIIKSQKLKASILPADEKIQEEFYPGTLLKCNKTLLAACGSRQYLEILKLQPSGKTVMPAEDFLNGHLNIPVL